jgi:hypothetical protein
MKSKKRQNGGKIQPNMIAIIIGGAVVLSLFGGGLYKLLDNQNQEDIPDGSSYSNQHM